MTNGRSNLSRLKARDISESLGKLPPQACDLEEAILGAIMLEKQAIQTALSCSLKSDHFYKDSHQEIFQAILSLFHSNSPIDMRTVITELRRTGKIELIGGYTVIPELTAKVSSAANIEFHIRIVQEHAMKRKLIEFASLIHTKAYEDTEDVFKIVDEAQAGLDKISGANLKDSINSVADILDEAVKRIIALRNALGITGVESGWLVLDKFTGGFQVGLIIIAARPGMGKTAVAVGIVLNASIRYKKPVALFSLEMSSNQIMNRMIASESEIELERMIKGQCSDTEIEIIKKRTEHLKTSGIYIDDTPAMHYLKLRTKVRRLVAECKVELIIIDYLQLMKGDQDGNREREIASISAALKNLSKEVNRPIIAFSQLSRAVETRGGDKRPQLSDLRESGSIEQDANMVAFLYRPEYYDICEDANGFSTLGNLEVIIAKHRDGPTGTVKLKFLNKFVKVIDDSPQFNPDVQQSELTFKRWDSRRGYVEEIVDPEKPF